MPRQGSAGVEPASTKSCSQRSRNRGVDDATTRSCSRLNEVLLTEEQEPPAGKLVKTADGTPQRSPAHRGAGTAHHSIGS